MRQFILSDEYERPAAQRLAVYTRPQRAAERLRRHEAAGHHLVGLTVTVRTFDRLDADGLPAVEVVYDAGRFLTTL